MLLTLTAVTSVTKTIFLQDLWIIANTQEEKFSLAVAMQAAPVPLLDGVFLPEQKCLFRFCAALPVTFCLGSGG